MNKRRGGNGSRDQVYRRRKGGDGRQRHGDEKLNPGFGWGKGRDERVLERKGEGNVQNGRSEEEGKECHIFSSVRAFLHQ